MKSLRIAFAFLALLCGQVHAADSRPNLVFVFADQLRSQSIGCYGEATPATPNIDRLATEGARFTHAFSTYPLCSPFRAMLMTGLYPAAVSDVKAWIADPDSTEESKTSKKTKGAKR